MIQENILNKINKIKKKVNQRKVKNNKMKKKTKIFYQIKIVFIVKTLNKIKIIQNFLSPLIKLRKEKKIVIY